MSGDPWEDALAEDQDDPWEAALRAPEPEQSYGYDSQGMQPSVLRPQTDPNQTLAHSQSAPRTDQSFFRQPPDASRWDKALEGMNDGGLAAAGGVLKGVGINPQRTLGPGVRDALEVANERSPNAAPIGNLVGEAGIQTLATHGMGASPIAQGAVSGALSGLGNADTDDWAEKINAMKGGAVIGGLTGGLAGSATGGVANKLEQKAPQWADEQASYGLQRMGADPSDLKYLDDSGGRQMFYDEGKRLGINGSPQRAAPAAQGVVRDAEALRAGIETGNPQIDPQAIGARIRGANPYPGVDQFDSVLDKAAGQVERAAPDFGAVDTQRAYFGKKGNFPKDTPEARLRQNIHGAINDEMEGALNGQNALGQQLPDGPGSQWRQAGRDERVGIELGDIATAGKDRARAKPPGWDAGDIATLGAKRVYGANRDAIKENAYGALRNVAKASDFVSEWGSGAPAAAAGAMSGELTGGSASVADTALDALAAGGRELGDYRDQFAEAASSPDQGAVSNLITRLTMSDPKFRQTTLSRLRQLGQR